MFFKKLVASAFPIAMLALVAPAHAATITATGDGWCESGGFCDNTNTNALSNTYGTEPYHDFFAFDIPLGSNFNSAVISIYNDASNFGNDGVFNLFAASSITYGGLVTGPSIGSVSVATANTGTNHFVDININSLGIAALNNASGSKFIFGGTNNGSGQIFGYTGGSPAAQLTFSSTAAPVPEPATWAMLLLGFGMVGFAMRKRSNVRTTVSYA